jgi:hypothetical protein
MRRFFAQTILLASVFALSACQFFAPGAGEQTLAAQNAALQTEIAAIRATATVEADRLMITLEHAQTAIRSVNEQTGELAATLVAAGTPADAINLAVITPQFVPPTLPPDGAPPPPAAGQPLLLTTIQFPTAVGALPGGDGALLTSPPAPLATPEADAASLTNIVAAPAVGADDCALNPATAFTTANNEIYIVATANNIEAGTVISTNWIANGQPIVEYDWTPDFAIEGACIWFFIDQSEVEFVPGNWQVQYAIDGVPSGSPVVFTIEGAAAQGDAAVEDAFAGQ